MGSPVSRINRYFVSLEILTSTPPTYERIGDISGRIHLLVKDTSTDFRRFTSRPLATHHFHTNFRASCIQLRYDAFPDDGYRSRMPDEWLSNSIRATKSFLSCVLFYEQSQRRHIKRSRMSRMLSKILIKRENSFKKLTAHYNYCFKNGWVFQSTRKKSNQVKATDSYLYINKAIIKKKPICMRNTLCMRELCWLY